MKRDNPQQTLVLCAFGLIPVVWAALLAAPAISSGLLEILTGLTAALNNPLAITWCEDSVKAILIFIAAYGMGIGIYFSTKRNTRPREEHGSAKWGEAAAVNKKYADRRFTENKVLTQNVRIGFDAYKHRPPILNNMLKKLTMSTNITLGGSVSCLKKRKTELSRAVSATMISKP